MKGTSRDPQESAQKAAGWWEARVNRIFEYIPELRTEESKIGSDEKAAWKMCGGWFGRLRRERHTLSGHGIRGYRQRQMGASCLRTKVVTRVSDTRPFFRIIPGRRIFLFSGIRESTEPLQRKGEKKNAGIWRIKSPRLIGAAHGRRRNQGAGKCG